MNQKNGFTLLTAILVILGVAVLLSGVFSPSFRRSVGLEKHPAYGRWNEVMMTYQKEHRNSREKAVSMAPLVVGSGVDPGTVVVLVEYRALKQTIPTVRKLGGKEYDDLIEKIVDDYAKNWDVAKPKLLDEAQKKVLLARVDEIDGIFGPTSKEETISIRRIVLADVGFRIVDKKSTGDEQIDLPLKLLVTLIVVGSF